MVKTRRRFKQQLTFQDRVVSWSREVLEVANALPPGPERDAMLKKVRQADVACHLDDWAKSPGLQSPK